MKRKNAETAQSGEKKVPLKKKKAEEFTEIEFRILIKDQNTRFSVLEKFLKYAEAFSKEHHNDIVAAYCKSSGECAEIFQLMEEGRRKPTELCLIFNVLEHILTRIATDLTRYQVVAENIIKKVLASFMNNVYFLLSKLHKSNQIKAALKLLSSMVIQGERAARDVFMQMNFNHSNIRPLLSRKDAKDPDDVRTCLIYFYMSLLLHGDNSLLRQFVSLKGILNSIFSGMTYDKPAVVELILETLQSKVIENTVINKTTKIRLFDESSLKSLIQLYYWKGPYKFKYGKKKDDAESSEAPEENMETDSDDLDLVRSNIHKLLLELCCSFKNGINFYDKTLGTSGKNQNHVLTAFLTSLKKPYNHSMTREVVINILKTCPDQLYKYLTSLQDAFLPRASPSWVACMNFLIEIYENQADVPSSLKTGDIQTSKLVQMAQVCIVPPSVILNFIIQAVKKRSSPLIRHMALKLVTLVLEKVQRVVAFFKSKECTYTSEVKREVIQLLEENIQKILPDFKSISSCWDLLLREQTAEGAEEMEVDEDGEAQESAPIDIGMVELQTTVIQSLAAYRKTFPHTTHEHFINLSSFLDGVKKASVEEEDQTKLSKLYLSVLSLLANSDTRMIPWSKVNDQGQSFVYLVLEMLFTTAYNQDLAAATKDQVVKLLVGTGLFDHVEDEIIIWLNKLISTEENSRPTILKYLEKVMTTLLTTPQAYTDQIAKVVQEAQQVENIAVTKGAGVDSAEDLIQSIISQDEVLLVKYESLEDEEDSSWDGSTLFATRIPFSPLVPVSLRCLEKFEEATTEINGYLSSVLEEILHGQVNPKPFNLMLEQRGTHFDDKTFKQYLESFMVEKGLEQSKTPEKAKLKKILKEESPSKILKVCWLKHRDLFLNQSVKDHVLAMTMKLTPRDQVGVMKQLLLYLHAVVTLTKQESEQSKELTDALLHLINSIINSNTSKSQGSTDSDTDANASQVDDESADMVKKVEACHQMIELVLKHPTITENFLVPEDDCSVPFSLALCISKNLPNVLQLALDAGMESALSVPYLDKLHQSIFDGKSDAVHKTISLLIFSRLASYIEGRRIVGILNKLLELTVGELVSEEGLRPAGETVFCVLNQVLKAKKINKNIGGFTYSAIETLCLIVLQAPSQTSSFLHPDQVLGHQYLYRTLKMFLQAFPHYTAVFDSINFGQLLRNGRCNDPELAPIILLVADLVLKFNTAGKTYFQEWIDCNGSSIRKHKLLYVPLYTTYLEISGSAEATPYVKLADDVYWEFGLNMLLEGSDEAVEEFMSSLLVLLLQHKSDQEVVAEAQKLFTQLQSKKAVPFCLTRLLEAVTNRLFDAANVQDDTDDATSTILAVLSCLSGVLVAKSDKQENVDVVVSFVRSVTKHLKQVDQESPMMKKLPSSLSPHWAKVVKTGLRNHFETVEVHQLLALLADYHYNGEDEADSDLTPQTFIEMIMSHSKFLPIMLAEVEDQKTKGALVDLLHAVISKKPSCCQQSHVSILLAAYGASLSATDRKLLQMLHIYESSGIDTSPYRPYLWGAKSVEHLSVKKDLGPSLWKHATTEQVLELLDEKRLMTSALKFPLRRKLIPSPEHSEELESVSDCYDPCFLLPLFSYLLRPDSLVNSHTFIERNCFGYTLAALSSHDHHMRGAAYHILARFTQQLEGSRLFAKEHVVYMLDCIRNSLETPNTKLACIIGVFLVKAAQLMINPVDHMYGMIQSFLLLKPSLDLVNIPEFYKLFNSSAIEFKIERRWILSLMADGLRESADYQIFQRKFAFKLLLSYHDSPTSDAASQNMVLKIVHEGCKIKKVAYELVKNQGILSWLNGLISHRLGDGPRVELIVNILTSLWSSIAGNRNNSKKDNKCLPLVFLSEMLFILLNLLQKVSDVLELDVCQKYMLVLSSVMKELQVTETTHVASGYQTLKLKPSLSHLLKLVELSAACSGDLEMITRLKALDFHSLVLIDSKANKGALPDNDGKKDSVDYLVLMEYFLKTVTSCSIDLTNIGKDTPKCEQDRVVQSVVLILEWVLKSLGSISAENWTPLLRKTLEWFVDILEKDCVLVDHLKYKLLEGSKSEINTATDYLLRMFSQISAVKVGDEDVVRVSSSNFKNYHHVCSVEDVTKLRLLLCKIFLLLTDWALKSDQASAQLDGLEMRARNFAVELTDADMLEEKESAAEKVSILLTDLWMGASNPRSVEVESNVTDTLAGAITPLPRKAAGKQKTPKTDKKQSTPRIDKKKGVHEIDSGGDQSTTPQVLKTPKSARKGVITPKITPKSARKKVLTPKTTPKSARKDVITPKITPRSARKGVITPRITPKSARKDVITPKIAPKSARKDVITPKITPKSARKGVITPKITPKSARKGVITPKITPGKLKKPKTPKSAKRA